MILTDKMSNLTHYLLTALFVALLKSSKARTINLNSTTALIPSINYYNNAKTGMLLMIGYFITRLSIKNLNVFYHQVARDGESESYRFLRWYRKDILTYMFLNNWVLYIFSKLLTHIYLNYWVMISIIELWSQLLTYDLNYWFIYSITYNITQLLE